MIRIINQRPDDWPEGESGPGPVKAKETGHLDLPKDKNYSKVERFAFMRKCAELWGIISALEQLPCEAEVMITIQDGGATTSGRIWMVEGGDTLTVLEEALGDIEAIASFLATKYPHCKVVFKYNRHQK